MDGVYYTRDTHRLNSVKRRSLVRRFRRPPNIQITRCERRHRRRISLGHYASRQPEQVVFG